MRQNKGSGRLLNNPAGVLEGQSPSVFFPPAIRLSAAELTLAAGHGVA